MLPRVSTGIDGLDRVLCGGLPAHRLYLVEGDPGVGKTTLALQFLLAGIAAGERVLYVTLSETEEEVRTITESHGWSIAGLSMFELSALEQRLRLDAEKHDLPSIRCRAHRDHAGATPAGGRGRARARCVRLAIRTAAARTGLAAVSARGAEPQDLL